MSQQSTDLDYVRHAALGNDSDRKLIAETFLQAAATCLRKNADYGSSVSKSPVLAPSMSPESAILVRLSDKIQRMSNLLGSGGTPQVDESVEDNILDMANYALLLIVARRKTKSHGEWAAAAASQADLMARAVATGELLEQMNPVPGVTVGDFTTHQICMADGFAVHGEKSDVDALVWRELHPIPNQRPHTFWSACKFGEFQVIKVNSVWVANLIDTSNGNTAPVITAWTSEEAIKSCNDMHSQLSSEETVTPYHYSSPENVDTANTPG